MNEIKPLRPILQEVIPTVYDNTLTYYELLNKVIYTVNNAIKTIDEYTSQDISYYVDLELNEMIKDGTFDKIISDNLKANEVETELNTFKSTVNTHFSSVDNSISELNSSLKYYKLKGRRLVAFGDSWIDEKSTIYTSKNYPHILADRYGMKYSSFAVSGATYSDHDAQKITLWLITQLNKAISDLSDTEKAETALVIVNAGGNDMHHLTGNTSSDFQTGVSNFYNKLSGVFPNARIVVILDHFYSGGNYILNQYTSILANVLKSTNNNVCFISDFYNMFSGLQYSWFNSDYKHPNDNGHKVIADIVASHLMGGTWNDNSVVFKAFTTYTDRHPTLKEESTIHAIVKNGTVTIPSITFNCSDDLTGNFGLWTLTEVGDAGKGNYNILPQQVVAMPVFSADLTKILGTWFLNSNGVARVDIGSNVTRSFRLSDMSYPLTGKAAVIPD